MVATAITAAPMRYMCDRTQLGGSSPNNSGNIQAVRERLRRSRFAIEAQLSPLGHREAAGFTFAKIAKGDGCDRIGQLGFWWLYESIR